MLTSFSKFKAIILLFFILLFLTHCKSVDKIVDTENNVNHEILQILYPDTLFLAENFHASIVNISTDTIIIYLPDLKQFEKAEGQSWRKVKIVQCPCGANCEPSPKTKKLNPGEKHFIDWNVQESWCGNLLKNGIPETIEIKAKPGNYRFSVTYSSPNTEKGKTVKEFTILEP